MHEFWSNLVLAQIALPKGFDFDPQLVRGRAAAQSLLQALMIAGAETLQIPPSELGGEIRGVSKLGSLDRTIECFIYDTLPNGAGYATQLKDQFEAVVIAAKELCKNCPSGCDSACYKCLLNYGNRLYHPVLDRNIAYEILNYVSEGAWSETATDIGSALSYLKPFAFSAKDVILPDTTPTLVVDTGNYQRCIVPIHPLNSDCSSKLTEASIRSGLQPVAVSTFDLIRRPFWVWKKVCAGAVGFREWELNQ
jgi:ATP-dependent helicase YprA (DUF1998 family)